MSDTPRELKTVWVVARNDGNGAYSFPLGAFADKETAQIFVDGAVAGWCCSMEVFEVPLRTVTSKPQ